MEAVSFEVLARGLELSARADNTSSSTTSKDSRPPVYKAIGISLAVASGCFIGVSFVLKKTGLLKANEKYNEEAGEGYGYLKNAWWWTGMTLMIIGEICNFVAYAFVDAILVTPLGALSVVITTILSAIFLKERLSFVGKIGCFNCIVGSVVIVMNAPEQSSVSDIQDMQHFVIAPGFLSYAGVIIAGSAFIALWAGPRYGKKSMLVYLSICSMIGGLSVVATQGLGAAIVAQISGKSQFTHWFLYVLLVFVITTLVTEIIYLNKALNLFNAALVTPTYYVFFTSATIITSAILFRGFKGTIVTIVTVVLGFLQICSGVVLLQLSKSAKDVPDAAVFKGDLDQVREVAEQEQPESEPKADAIRGTAALIRRFSVSRQKREEQEAKRFMEEKRKDQLEPVGENEVVEWDGLRRRKTIIGTGPSTTPVRRKTLHPPLGMSHFPEEEEQSGPHHANTDPTDGSRDTVHFFENVRNRAQTVFAPGRRTSDRSTTKPRSPMHPVALTEISVGQKGGNDTPIEPYGPGSLEEAQSHIYGLPPSLANREANRTASPRLAADQPSARRQFSFQNVFRKTPDIDTSYRPAPSPSTRSREQKRAKKNATEEERLGLVKGDSHAMLVNPEESRSLQHTHSNSSSTASSHEHMPEYDYHEGDSDSENDWQITSPPHSNPSPASGPAQPPLSVLGTATAMPITQPGSSSPRRKDVPPPSLPRAGQLPSSAQQQRALANQAESNRSQILNPNPPTTSASAARTREGSLTDQEYERQHIRFQDSRSQGGGGSTSSGGGAFI